MAMKNYLQFFCGEYPFLICTDAIAEIVNNSIDDVMARTELRNGVLFYSWNDQSIAVVNLNKRFGLDTSSSEHQIILDGSLKRSDSRIMVIVGHVVGIIDVADETFQPVQPLAGEFSKLVDATLILQDKNWLRIRSEYFY